jgi:RNA polymerase sigma factor (TIGR02999 family)
MARRELARRGRPSNLGVTTLLHETYLNISGRRGPCFPDRAQFMGYAARVMRGIIIDHARTWGAVKRGGTFEISSLEHDTFENPSDARQLGLIGDALDQLEKVEPGLAEVVDLKFFCGFSFAEIGALQNLSERSVQRKWEKARLYLYCSLRPDLAN